VYDFCVDPTQCFYANNFLVHNTDSVGIKLKLGDDPVKKGPELAKYLDSTFGEFVAQYGLKKHSLHIEFDKVYDKLLLLKKKNYIGHITNAKGKPTDKMIYAGVGSRRTDVSKLSKKIEQDVVKALFAGKSKHDIFELVRAQSLAVVANEVPLERDIEQYGTNLPRCRAAKWANTNLQANYAAGAKFYTLLVKKTAKVKTDIVGFDNEQQLKAYNIEIDKARIVEAQIMKKTIRIFDAIGWSKDFKVIHDSLTARTELGVSGLSDWC
jgi:DNA polymerase elongation subunit (family B)